LAQLKNEQNPGAVRDVSNSHGQGEKNDFEK
jgi:hypothetical protein